MEKEHRWLAWKRSEGSAGEDKNDSHDENSPFIIEPGTGKVRRRRPQILSDGGEYVYLTPEEPEKKGWKEWREKRKWRRKELARIRKLYKGKSIYSQRAWEEKG